MAYSKISVEPNNSTPRKIEARGALTQAQNTAVSPKAAANPGSSPRSEPAKQPKVEPTKNTGTISPPLNPVPKVMAVNIIFAPAITHILKVVTKK